MARDSDLAREDAPWHLRWFYCVMRKMFGGDFTPTKIQMHLPPVVWGGIARETALGRRRIVSLRSFNWEKSAPLRVRLSLLSRRQFCRGQKSRPGDAKLLALLRDERTPFNDTERLVIELADAMTDTPANVSDDLYARLRKQFSEEQLML